MPEVVLAVLSAIGSTVASVVTFARVIFDIKNTRTDVKTCLDLVQRVDQDIQYAISLRTKNLKLLSENPDELRRIDGIIGAATDSIMDVGRLLEGCRPEAHGGRVPFRGKVKWVLGDSTAFLRRTGNLQQQHAAINIEIAYMRKLGPLKASADPVTNTIFENTELLWMERKRNPSKVSVLDEIGILYADFPKASETNCRLQNNCNHHQATLVQCTNERLCQRLFALLRERRPPAIIGSVPLQRLLQVMRQRAHPLKLKSLVMICWREILMKTQKWLSSRA
jgi:hypothetical protein